MEAFIFRLKEKVIINKQNSIHWVIIIIKASSLYVGMRGIFQDGSQFGNFQTLISLLSYFLRLYNWFS